MHADQRLLVTCIVAVYPEHYAFSVRRESKDRRRPNAQAKVLTFYNSVGE